jgi:hypothetical protein
MPAYREKEHLRILIRLLIFQSVAIIPLSAIKLKPKPAPTLKSPCIGDFHHLLEWTDDEITEWNERRAQVIQENARTKTADEDVQLGQKPPILITEVDDKYKMSVKATEPQHLKYCSEHGYEWKAYNISKSNLDNLPQDERDYLSNHHPAYHKMFVIHKTLLEGHTYVGWIDSDAVIVNRNISFGDFFKSSNVSIDWVVQRDPMYPIEEHRKTGNLMINTGVFIVRNSPWTLKAISDILYSPEYEYAHQQSTKEQLAIRHVLCREPFHFHVFEGDEMQTRVQTSWHPQSWSNAIRRISKTSWVVHSQGKTILEKEQQILEVAANLS